MIAAGTGLVVVAVLATVLALRVTGGDNPGPVPPVSGGDGGIPAAFAGTWEGNIQSTGTNQNYDIEIILAEGERSGSWHEHGTDCDGELRLTQVRDDALDMRLLPSAGCVPGDVTLSLDNGRLHYDWQDDMGLLGYTGMLERS